LLEELKSVDETRPVDQRSIDEGEVPEDVKQLIE
jgi:hypothetical protein